MMSPRSLPSIYTYPAFQDIQRTLPTTRSILRSLVVAWKNQARLHTSYRETVCYPHSHFPQTTRIIIFGQLCLSTDLRPPPLFAHRSPVPFRPFVHLSIIRFVLFVIIGVERGCFFRFVVRVFLCHKALSCNESLQKKIWFMNLGGAQSVLGQAERDIDVCRSDDCSLPNVFHDRRLFPSP